jgi:hypothetical protein
MSTATQHEAKHDVRRLEARIKDLRNGLMQLGGDADFDEMLRIIHFPGYTTPAEFLMVAGLIESMNEQVKGLTDLKNLVVGASRMIVGK